MVSSSSYSPEAETKNVSIYRCAFEQEVWGEGKTPSLEVWLNADLTYYLVSFTIIVNRAVDLPAFAVYDHEQLLPVLAPPSNTLLWTDFPTPYHPHSGNEKVIALVLEFCFISHDSKSTYLLPCSNKYTTC